MIDCALLTSTRLRRAACARTALDKLEIRANTTLVVDDVVEYLLPFQDLGGNVVHETASGASDAEIPTIEALRDLVPIIYPGRSRG